MALWVLIRGGGDLASGVVLRLYRAGLQVLVTELPEPLMVRRKVSFAEAIYEGETFVEEAPARRAEDLERAISLARQRVVPVLVDPEAATLKSLRERVSNDVPIVLVDARMTKQRSELSLDSASLVIGLGPGFVAGENCHAVVETMRSHWLGRVIWQGAPEADTGIPDPVNDKGAERVLRAPAAGKVEALAEIGERLRKGQQVAAVSGQPVLAPFDGVLRGLVHPGLQVSQGMKIGDVDPRGDPRYCFLVSDKSLAIGGGVLEAILMRPEIRPHLWD